MRALEISGCSGRICARIGAFGVSLAPFAADTSGARSQHSEPFGSFIAQESAKKAEVGICARCGVSGSVFLW